MSRRSLSESADGWASNARIYLVQKTTALGEEYHSGRFPLNKYNSNPSDGPTSTTATAITQTIVLRTPSGLFAVAIVISGGTMAGYCATAQPHTTAVTVALDVTAASMKRRTASAASEPKPVSIDDATNGQPRALNP